MNYQIKKIEIPEPHFNLYQLVIVHLDGKQHVTEITRRYYDPDSEDWLYGVRGLEGLYPANIIDFKGEPIRETAKGTMVLTLIESLCLRSCLLTAIAELSEEEGMYPTLQRILEKLPIFTEDD